MRSSHNKEEQVKLAAIPLALVSSFALGYVIDDLAGGVAEVPRHWWSTAPLFGLFMAGTLATRQ